MGRIKWTLLLIVFAMNVNAQTAHHKHPSAKDSVILSAGLVFQRNIKSLQGDKWQLWFRKEEEVTLIDEVEHKKTSDEGFLRYWDSQRTPLPYLSDAFEDKGHLYVLLFKDFGAMLQVYDLQTAMHQQEVYIASCGGGSIENFGSFFVKGVCWEFDGQLFLYISTGRSVAAKTERFVYKTDTDLGWAAVYPYSRDYYQDEIVPNFDPLSRESKRLHYIGKAPFVVGYSHYYFYKQNDGSIRILEYSETSHRLVTDNKIFIAEWADKNKNSIQFKEVNLQKD